MSPKPKGPGVYGDMLWADGYWTWMGFAAAATCLPDATQWHLPGPLTAEAG